MPRFNRQHGCRNGQGKGRNFGLTELESNAESKKTVCNPIRESLQIGLSRRKRCCFRQDNLNRGRFGMSQNIYNNK
jgi:hypothetical protein